MIKKYSINRRTYIGQAIVLGVSSLLMSRAQAQAMLSESDVQAQGLGYTSDASKVDRVAQPKYMPGQTCKQCSFYKGKAADSTGACNLFAGKRVVAIGWCSAFVTKVS